MNGIVLAGFAMELTRQQTSAAAVGVPLVAAFTVSNQFADRLYARAAHTSNGLMLAATFAGAAGAFTAIGSDPGPVHDASIGALVGGAAGLGIGWGGYGLAFRPNGSIAPHRAPLNAFERLGRNLGYDIWRAGRNTHMAWQAPLIFAGPLVGVALGATPMIIAKYRD